MSVATLERPKRNYARRLPMQLEVDRAFARKCRTVVKYRNLPAGMPNNQYVSRPVFVMPPVAAAPIRNGFPICQHCGGQMILLDEPEYEGVAFHRHLVARRRCLQCGRGR